MKRSLFIVLILIVGVILCFHLPSLASDRTEDKPGIEGQKERKAVPPQSDEQKDRLSPKGAESQDQKSATPIGQPVYQPPLRGAPGGRIGGGTRGIGDERITLFVLGVLAPNHVGLTIQGQPNLYWYISKPTNLPIEVTIIEDQAISPLLEKRINLPVQAGINCLRLTDYRITLLPGQQYRWFVGAIASADHRSRDIIAGGMIERIEVPESLRVKLSHADKRNIPSIYAESGIWYDAIMAISELIEANPSDANLRRQRAALLEQVGLSQVAHSEMKEADAAK